MLAIEIRQDHRAIASDQSTMDILRNGHFGTLDAGVLLLSPEETLYLIDIRNASCSAGGKAIGFNDAAALLCMDKKTLTRYLTYRDWRDKGLLIGPASSTKHRRATRRAKMYPGARLRLSMPRLDGMFFPDSLTTVVDDQDAGRAIYAEHWLGQYATYKASERGMLNKLDIYETVFLEEAGLLGIRNATRKEVITVATARRPDFPKLYEVYADWRRNGYIVKTGFKFGTHFRIYFPGAKPERSADGTWLHSKHVIHVFPRDAKLLTSEWARAIRVAHSVRKTFILAIPGRSRSKNVSIDFVLYHRRGMEAQVPGVDEPSYGMLSLSEDERIGGAELSAAIGDAAARGLELVIAIADRETAVTYYKARRISLPRSDYEYYEIDWMQP